MTVLASPASTIATTTTVAGSSATSVAGQAVTFIASVASQGPGGALPSGTVTFMDGDSVLDVETLSGGAASFTTSALEVGSHTITAVYSGDAYFVASTSGMLSQQVEDLNATNLQDVVSAAQSTGSSVVLATPTTDTLTSTLGAISGLSSSSAGAVTVDLSNSAIYQQLDGSGNVIPIAASAPAGVTLTILCSSGNATIYDLQPSGGNVEIHGVPGQGSITIVGNSPALTVGEGAVTIGPGVTLLTTTDSPTILVTGGSLTLRGAVVEESSSYNQAAISITGGNLDLGTVASPGGNIFNVNGTGEFLRDTTSSPVSDVGNTLDVDGAPLPESFLSLASLGSSAAPSTLGQPVTFTATVAATNPADGTPTGTVDFVDTTTGADLGTAGLVNGVAMVTTSSLGLGDHAIMARYEGDGTFAFSSGAANQTVNPSAISTTTAVTSSLNSPFYGQGVAFTATVAPGTTGSGTPTGTVQFKIDGADFGSPLQLVNGTATIGTIQTLDVGTHTITAIYSGTTGFGGDTTYLSSSASTTIDVLPPASLSGVVFADFNDDGQIDFGENGIPGVPITLTGTDFLGNPVSLGQNTDADGTYVFQGLLPGTYTINETQQPAGYTPGINSVGTGGGTLSGAQFTVTLTAGEDAMNYNYGGRPAATGPIQEGQTAGIGFWNNKNGQALIKALNGGGASTQLGDWLASTFPHMFGADAGSNDLAGRTNDFIASFFQSRFVVHGQKLDAQVLATALNVYVTNATLDDTGVGTQYGFDVSGDGLGIATYNVGINGDAFGVSDNTVMTVLDILLAADAQAVDGVLYNGDTTKRTKANNVFSGINEAGSI